MDLQFFSLDSTLGTARALVYWDRLTTDQKVNILLSSSRLPEPEFLDLVLADGDPLCMEIAFRFLRRSVSVGITQRDVLDSSEGLFEHLNRVWKARLGFSPWDVEAFPMEFASDFYLWFHGESVDGPCAELESWAKTFFARGQFEQRLLIEHGACGPFMSSVGVLTVGIRKKKLFPDEASRLFISAVSASYDEDCTPWVPSWDAGIGWDNANVLTAFISEIALEDDGDNHNKLRSPLRAVIFNLPQLILSDESVEPFLNIPDHALNLMLKYEHDGKRRHDYTLLRQRISATKREI